MIILAIETSCDDTSVAIIKDGKIILSNLIASQNELHSSFGGIVPEVASRKHLEVILPLIDQALEKASEINRAKISLKEIDVFAVTNQPGLVGSLYIGVNTAKTLAYHLERPLISVNHLDAHFYSVPMNTDIEYPFIGLLVSGGHTLLAKCTSPTNVEIIGSTLDDACGECFDKIAQHFKIGYPGGPILDRLAQSGDPTFFQYPIVKISTTNQSGLAEETIKKKYHFSYSGLKTAVIHQSKKYLHPTHKKNSIFFKRQNINNELDWDKIKIEDLAASFQHASLQSLLHQTLNACRDHDIYRVGVCGGVSANQGLRKLFDNHLEIKSFFPDLTLCTDNAAMIGGLAYEIIRADQSTKTCPTNPAYSTEDLFNLKVSAQGIRAKIKN